MTTREEGKIEFDEDPPENYAKDTRNECYESCLKSCGSCCGFFRTWVCCCCVTPYQKVPEGTYGVIKEFGKFLKVVPPGLQYVNIMTEELILVDKREQTVDLKRQSLITKDNVTIILDAVIYFKILDPYRSQFDVSNLLLAITEIAKTTLKDVIGNTILQDAFEKREIISQKIRDIVDQPTEVWGVDVTRVLIQEILLSPDLQMNLSSAATAKRIAEGKIINAQADVDSAKLMREASDVLNTPSAMQIRYLDAMTGLAGAQNTKVVFMPSSNSKESTTDIKALKRYLIQNEIS
jgi:erythrocyte band 7 integral membrane protein